MPCTRQVQGAFPGVAPEKSRDSGADVEELARELAGKLRGIRNLLQSSHRGTEVRFRRVPELRDQWMVFEHLLNDAALDAFAASMNQSHFAQAGFVRRSDILLDDRCHIAWCEGMQVERIFDRDLFQDG